MRNPTGENGVGATPRRQLLCNLLPLRLQRVDAKVERRALRQRRAFGNPIRAERRFEMRHQPFRQIGAHLAGRIVELGGFDMPDRLFGDRLGRVAILGEALVQGARIVAPCEDGRPDREVPGRVSAHAPGDRRAAAKRVVDEVADGGAVARPGEAVRHAPVPQRLAGRAVARIDVGQHFRRSGDQARDPHAVKP